MVPKSFRLLPLAAALAAALAPAAMAGASAREPVVGAPAGANWRTVATEDDRDRLRRWRSVWIDALAQANLGHADEIAAGGALFDPDAALAGTEPPPGDYDCRTVKLGRAPPGGAAAGQLDYVAYPAFRCRIAAEEGRLVFTKLTGAQRPAGTIFPDNGRRMIFLGTMILGDETRALRYSRDRERDLIGILERIGERRWRLVFPRPRHESLLDVIELTPRR